jgi:hypothetical protein
VIPSSLEAQKSVDAFDHSDIAVPPIMEEVRDSQHVFIGRGSDQGGAVREAVFTDGDSRRYNKFGKVGAISIPHEYSPFPSPIPLSQFRTHN